MTFLKGRTNRAVYWLCIGIILVFSVVARMVLHSQAGATEVVLAFACIPRLHDIGRSGWLVLWGIGLEIVVVLGGVLLLPLQVFALAVDGLVVVILGLLIWLGSIKGDPAANRFGEPPGPGLGVRKTPAN